MRVIPVIDLKQGCVVRGVGGRREEYRPVESMLAADASPAAVARGFVQKLNLRQAYVADLDAIGGAEPAWDVYEQLVGCGLDLWIDAGLTDPRRARRFAVFQAGGRPLHGVVAGLESLESPELLVDLLQLVGPERFVFSLDLKAGRPLAARPAWQGFSPEQIAEVALAAGVRRMIVLDLAQVGMGGGVGTLPLCRAIRARAADLELIGGGGIRGMNDLGLLRDAGCDAALVASALHDGRITAEDIARL